MTNSEYSLVVVIVNKGQSEKVVHIAEDLGAGGGTIFFGRGSSVRSHASILGVSVEPSMEIVYIVSKRELASKIINEINQKCNLDEPEAGLACSMRLEEVSGLDY